MTYLLFALGLLLLAFGAELFVRGAANIALAINIPKLIIGLTIVSFGTGTPELLVTALSAYEGDTSLALGNVIGSNICNTFLIIGIASLCKPLKVPSTVVKTDLLVMIAASLITYLIAIEGAFDRVVGFCFLLLTLVYLLFLYIAGPKKDEELPPQTTSKVKRIGFLLGGLLSLLVGAEMVISFAQAIAISWGVSTLVIGLTLVALGTSLPELATSVVASLQGESDLSIGNVIGSNIFNLLVVLGTAAFLAEEPIKAPSVVLTWDFPILVGGAFILLPILLTRKEISRIEGAFLLALYFLYLFLPLIFGLE